MIEEDSISNIDWEQKKGVADQTRASRRIDAKKIAKAEFKDRNNFKTTKPSIKNLTPGLKKLRNKIRDPYDDEEDEDENEVVFCFSLEGENSSLYNALRDDEKSKLQAKKVLDNQKMQQSAGKMEAIMMADKMSKKLGLKGLNKKVINNNMQSVALSSETFSMATKQNVAAKTKIKTENLSAKDTTNMVQGLKKMQQVSLSDNKFESDALKSMKVDDLIEIGKARDEHKTAEMILEKSGRKEAKKQPNTNKDKKKQNVKEAIRRAKDR